MGTALSLNGMWPPYLIFSIGSWVGVAVGSAAGETDGCWPAAAAEGAVGGSVARARGMAARGVGAASAYCTAVGACSGAAAGCCWSGADVPPQAIINTRVINNENSAVA